MAHDPRTIVQRPRSFTVGKKDCPGISNALNNEASARKDFFGGLGKIGDIEVLNRFGDGKISSGLRTLAKLSNSVRTGDTNSAIIPNDRGYVLEAVGINPNAAEKAGQFNPGVLNRGTAQAEVILADVKKGNYKLENIPDTFQDLQNLGQLVDGIFNDGSGESSTKSLELCGASPYAVDLIRFAPKYKFLFIVQITLSPAYQNPNSTITAKQLAFVVKNSTRPNVNIEHEEVNMYNFWTRIPKRTIFEPITMRFYDDNKGYAHLFYTSYLRSISPITRTGGVGQAGVLNIDWLEANSMQFNNINTQSTASITALEGNTTSIIQELQVYHIYDYGRFMNVYHYHHPKLLTMNLDDLDVAENGGGNEIEFQFAYDALHITPSLSIAKNPDRIRGITGGDTAIYPINPNFQGATEPEYLEGITDEDDAHKPQSVNILTDVKTAIPQRAGQSPIVNSPTVTPGGGPVANSPLTSPASLLNIAAAGPPAISPESLIKKPSVLEQGNLPIGASASENSSSLVDYINTNLPKPGNFGGKILK